MLVVRKAPARGIAEGNRSESGKKGELIRRAIESLNQEAKPNDTLTQSHNGLIFRRVDMRTSRINFF
ncbi:MAG: hypothetical protein AB7P69_16690 [Candidatus Binatia bacterium]